ncbi:hypothetical protein DPEC_G00296200 [Dallia pectoralis]|uniref:Uncharacterized protein n=1 Tax=Dallia pectoralis TaxID=75939 RepID=A0ACC2FJ03_DALPE|nr:hypothetical protein DPEC_G00296200 [Dallia pectoralis]
MISYILCVAWISSNFIHSQSLSQSPAPTSSCACKHTARLSVSPNGAPFRTPDDLKIPDNRCLYGSISPSYLLLNPCLCSYQQQTSRFGYTGKLTFPLLQENLNYLSLPRFSRILDSESQDDEPSSPLLTQADLKSFKAELSADISAALFGQLQTFIEAAITPISKALDQVKTSIEQQTHRSNDLERRYSNHDERIAGLEAVVSRLEAENRALWEKAEDLESQSRRNNIRLLVIPEASEAGDPIGFVVELLAELLPTIFNTPPKLDRAHSVGPRLSGDGNTTRKP